MKKTNISRILIIIFLALEAPFALASNLPFYQSEQNLKIGMSGPLVKELQAYLAGINLYPNNKITGYFGPLTATSVKLFQIKSSIIPTGIVGKLTRAKITNLTALTASAATTTVSLPVPMVVPIITNIATTTFTATSSEFLKYSLHSRPDYDFKKLAKDIQILINDKRTENGLSPLYWDEDLADVAEEHSVDQANDNIDITKSEIVCHYPLIRHEGFTHTGYSLKDRYSAGNIKYRYGGENIAMIPLSKNLLYLHKDSEPLTVCPEIDKFPVEAGPEEEKTALFKQVFNEAKDAVKGLQPVEWVNKEWRDDRELADMTVDGWMNSPGHRDNILRKEYTVAGIGIAVVNDDIIITHDFVGR